MRPRLVRRAAHAEGIHVPLEVELLHGGHLVVVLARPVGCCEQDVVDVGDVAADLDSHAEPAQQPVDGVDPDVRGGVPQVGHVVGGDAADVHAGSADDGQGVPVPPGRGQHGGSHLAPRVGLGTASDGAKGLRGSAR